MRNQLPNHEVSEVQKAIRKLIPKPAYLSLLIINILSAILFMVAPVLLNRKISNTGDIFPSDIVLVVAFLISAYLVQFAAVFLKNILIHKTMIQLSAFLFQRVFRLQYDTYIEQGASALLDLSYNAASDYTGFYFGSIPDLLVSVITIGVTLGIAISLNPFAAVLMFLMLPLHFFGFRFLNQKLSQMSVHLRNTSSLSFRNIHSILSQVDFIKQNADNTPFLPYVKRNIDSLEGVRKRVNYLANGASGLLNGLNQIIQTFLVIFLSALALQNHGNLGNVVYVILILPYFSNGIRNLTFVNSGIAAKQSADEFLRLLIENQEESGGRPWEEPIHTVRFDIPVVSVGGKTLLENVQFCFHKGDIVGIQGESGTGKSTLLKLLPKFRSIDGIFINEHPIQEIRNRDYLSRVSYYSQNTPIISDTLYNNLNLGRQALPRSIYQNLPFLRKFEDLDETILEDGANLSGGDKQRIALARFFHEAADVVILDEPTSSLDRETEYNILSEMLQQVQDKIIFIISHNPDIMKFCTHIVEIKDQTAVVRRQPSEQPLQAPCEVLGDCPAESECSV